jgi:hypothetical protein
MTGLEADKKMEKTKKISVKAPKSAIKKTESGGSEKRCQARMTALTLMLRIRKNCSDLEKISRGSEAKCCFALVGFGAKTKWQLGQYSCYG